MTRARDTAGIIQYSNITIDSNNAVGIGSSIPDAKLDINGNLFVTGITSTSDLNVTGVSTFLGHVEFKGSGGSSSLYVYDNNIINVGSGNDLTISHSSANSVSRIREDGGNLEISANPIELQHSDSTKLETTGGGISVTGITTSSIAINVGSAATIDANGARVAGIVTATSFSGSGANLTNLNIPATFDWRDSSLF